MPGLLRGMARTAVVAGTATAVSNRVSRRQANRWSQQSQAPADYYEPQPPAPVAAAPPAPPPDPIAQLKELAALRESGVLTDQEFTAQKARVLSSV
jgi:hypothetical protein